MSFCLRRTVMVYRRTVILLTSYHCRLSSYRRFDYVVSLSFIVVPSFCVDLRRIFFDRRRIIILLTSCHFCLSSYRYFTYVVPLSFIVSPSFCLRRVLVVYCRSIICLRSILSSFRHFAYKLMSYFIAFPPFSLRRAIVVYRRTVILLTLCHCRASSHCYFAYVVPLLFIVAPLFYLGYVYVVSLPFIVEPLFCLRRITVVYRRTVILLTSCHCCLSSYRRFGYVVYLSSYRNFAFFVYECRAIA